MDLLFFEVLADAPRVVRPVAVERLDLLLNLRLGIANNFNDESTWFVSTVPVVVSPGADWNSVSFQIDEAAMTQLGGAGDSFEAVMSDVTHLRLLSSVNLPTVAAQGGLQGDRIAASIGVDNITAIGIPEPTTASLGLLASGLLVGVRRSLR